MDVELASRLHRGMSSWRCVAEVLELFRVARRQPSALCLDRTVAWVRAAADEAGGVARDAKNALDLLWTWVHFVAEYPASTAWVELPDVLGAVEAVVAADGGAGERTQNHIAVVVFVPVPLQGELPNVLEADEAMMVVDCGLSNGKKTVVPCFCVR